MTNTARKPVLVKVDRSTGRRAADSLSRAAARLRGKTDRVAMTIADVEALAELLEDMEDVALYQARAGEPTIPHEVVTTIVGGVHPVRAWRSHKGFTLKELAAESKIPVGYLSEIETGKKPGSIAAYKALAKALGTEIDMLVTE